MYKNCIQSAISTTKKYDFLFSILIQAHMVVCNTYFVLLGFCYRQLRGNPNYEVTARLYLNLCSELNHRPLTSLVWIAIRHKSFYVHLFECLCALCSCSCI